MPHPTYESAVNRDNLQHGTRESDIDPGCGPCEAAARARERFREVLAEVRREVGRERGEQGRQS